MKQTLLLLTGAMLLIACHERRQVASETATAVIPETQELAQQVKHLDELVKRMDVPSQIFEAPTSKVSIITGKKGTVVFIAPGDLECEDGTTMTGDIKIELKELSDQSDMVRAAAPTISSGKLLVSGGAYYIKMTSSGKQLKLKNGRTLKVAFPKSTNDMELFYGQRDSIGNMNWLQAKQKLLSSDGYEKKDTPSIMIYEERNFQMMAFTGTERIYQAGRAKLDSLRKQCIEARIAQRTFINRQQVYEDSILGVRRRAVAKLNATLYDIAEVKQMGWLNCDKFYKGEDRSDFSYTIARADSIVCANIYLIFKDINSALSNPFVAALDSPTQFFYQVPTDRPVRLVAVGYKRDHLYAGAVDITTAADQHTHLVWHESSDAEVAALFKVKDR